MEGNTGHKVFQTQFGECGDLRNFTMCRFYKYTCKSTKSLMNLHQIITLSDVQIKKNNNFIHCDIKSYAQGQRLFINYLKEKLALTSAMDAITPRTG